jgi:hypothetical protein
MAALLRNPVSSMIHAWIGSSRWTAEHVRARRSIA